MKLELQEQNNGCQAAPNHGNLDIISTTRVSESLVIDVAGFQHGIVVDVLLDLDPSRVDNTVVFLDKIAWVVVVNVLIPGVRNFGIKSDNLRFFSRCGCCSCRRRG